jgi:hypothetical protein
MGYGVDIRQTTARKPYRVDYLQRGRRVFRRFGCFRDANRFRRSLPLGAESKMRFCHGGNDGLHRSSR